MTIRPSHRRPARGGSGSLARAVESRHEDTDTLRAAPTSRAGPHARSGRDHRPPRSHAGGAEGDRFVAHRPRTHQGALRRRRSRGARGGARAHLRRTRRRSRPAPWQAPDRLAAAPGRRRRGRSGRLEQAVHHKIVTTSDRWRAARAGREGSRDGECGPRRHEGQACRRRPRQGCRGETVAAGACRRDRRESRAGRRACESEDGARCAFARARNRAGAGIETDRRRRRTACREPPPVVGERRTRCPHRAAPVREGPGDAEGLPANTGRSAAAVGRGEPSATDHLTAWAPAACGAARQT